MSGALTLIGPAEGVARLRVKAGGELRVEAPGNMHIKRVTLTGDAATGPLVRAVGGRLVLDGCIVGLGGAPSAISCERTARVKLKKCRLARCSPVAVAVADDAVVSLDRCTVDRGDLAVYVMGERARVSLVGVKMSKGGTAVLAKGGAVSLESCQLLRHTKEAIVASGTAEIALADCLIERGEASAVVVSDEAVVNVAESRIRHNAGVGVSLAGRASLGMDASLVHDNGGAGVSLADESSARVSGGNFNANFHGLLATGRSEAALVKASANQNRHMGLVARGSARLEARECRLGHNMEHGILVAEEAKAELTKNLCEANLGAGIAFEGTASGSARRNRCVANVRAPIVTPANADPVPLANRRDPAWEAPEALDDLLVRLEIELARERPALYETLRPPVGYTDFRDAESRLGLKLPAGFEALYRWHDGSDPGPDAVFWRRLRLLPLADALALHDELTERAAARTTPLVNDWHAAWLPVMAGPGGNVLCLDAAGSFGGNRGQLISVVDGGEERPVESPSLEAWLVVLMDGKGAGPSGYPITTRATPQRRADIQLVGNVAE